MLGAEIRACICDEAEILLTLSCHGLYISHRLTTPIFQGRQYDTTDLLVLATIVSTARDLFGLPLFDRLD